MKKKILLTIIATLMVTCGTFAQNKLVATLKHGGSTTFFYGSSAIQLAHDAAESGDTITLSAGIFDDITISKPITIRGAGMRNDLIEKFSPTYIQNLSFSKDAKDVQFEGINFKKQIDLEKCKNIHDITFTRCVFLSLIPGENSIFTFLNSIITEQITVKYSNINLNAINSIIMYIEVSDKSSVLTAENCLIGYMSGNLGYSSFKNSILFPRHNQFWPIDDTANCSNCLGINQFFEDNSNIFINISNNDNLTIYSFDVFKTLRCVPEPITWYSVPEYSETENFELTDEAATQYLGDDGTQIGIYGGKFPFTTKLSYPQFTKANVAKEAINGKLSVNIELNGGN